LIGYLGGAKTSYVWQKHIARNATDVASKKGGCQRDIVETQATLDRGLETMGGLKWSSLLSGGENLGLYEGIRMTGVNLGRKLEVTATLGGP
jgi:hypothetical protein